MSLIVLFKLLRTTLEFFNRWVLVSLQNLAHNLTIFGRLTLSTSHWQVMIFGFMSLFRHSHQTLQVMMGQTTVKSTLNILISTLKILYSALCFSNNFLPCLKQLKNPRFGKQFNSTLTTWWRCIHLYKVSAYILPWTSKPRYNLNNVFKRHSTVAWGTFSLVVLLQWRLKY